MPESEIQEAVEKAATTETQEQVTETKETPKEDKTSQEESKLDERTTRALNLLDALEDPKKATLVVQNLMQQIGLAPKTEKEEQQAERTIRKLVKEELGEEYSFMSDKIGSAIEKALALQEQKLLEMEKAKEAQRAAVEYEQFITDNKVTDNEAGELMKLVDEMPWSGKGSLTNYLSKILKLHRGSVSEQKAEMLKRQKQQENLDKRPKTMGVDANEDRIIKGSGTISAREAVEAALRGERLE